MLKFQLIAFSVFLCFSLPLLACKEPPPEQIAPFEELVARTNYIFLAEVEKVEDITAPNTRSRRMIFPGPVHDRVVYTKYHLKVLEELKGKMGEEKLVIEGQPALSKEEGTFSHHTEKRFWENESGRSPTGRLDCKIEPRFKLGKKYLIFFNKPYHRKSFERIDDLNDQWLSTVRRNLSKE